MGDGGNIVVQLTLDNKDYKLEVKNSAEILSTLKRALDDTSKSVKNIERSATSMGTRFRDVVLTLGNLRFVLMDINDVFLRLPMSILKTAGQLEQTQVLLKGLSTASSEAARDMEAATDFKFVTDLAKNAPFALSALSDSFVKLKVAGIDPTQGGLQAMVDSVARFGGSGEQLKRATVAIQQMAGKGVVSMEELRQQLGEAVPTAMQDMADGMKMSMAELAKEVSKGIVVAGPAIDKMLLQMAISNEGAAKAMMESWVGMTQRLQSEWELMSLHIAESGLGQAAKDVVSDLTSMLRTEEFREFATQFGGMMGDTIRWFADAGRAAVQYGDTILTLGKVWAAYKVYTAFLGPWNEALKRSWTDQKASMGAYSNMMRATMKGAADEARASAIAQQVALRQTALDREQTAGLARQAAQQDLAAAKRYHAQLEAAQIMHQNRMRTIQAAGMSDGRAERRVAEASAANAAAMAANAAAMAKMTAEVKKHDMAMGLAGNAVAAHGAKIKALEASTMALTRAKTAMANVITKTVGGAFNLMGGWLGLAITAIGALAMAWDHFGNQAEKAADRAERAAARISKAEDAADAAQWEAEKKREAQLAQRTADRYDADPTATTELRAAARAEAKAAQDAYAEAQRTTSDVQRSLLDKGARDYQRAIDNSLKTWRDTHKAEVRQKLVDSDAQRDTEIKALDKGAKDYTKQVQRIRDAATDREREIYIKGKEAELAGIEAAERTLGARMKNAAEGSAQRAGLVTVLDGMQSDRERLVAEIKANKETIAQANQFNKADKKDKTKSAGAVKKTPLQLAIEKMAGEKVELESRIKSFQESLVKADDAFAAGEAMRAKIAAGAYDSKDKKTGKVTKPTDKEKEELIAHAENQVRMNDALKAAEKFVSDSKTIEDDYREAIEMLANPDGVGNGSAEKQARLDGLILPKDLEAQARAMNMSLEQLQGQMQLRMHKLTTIDLAAPMRDMEEESRRLSISLIRDDRERTRLQIQYENELAAARDASLLAKLKDDPMADEQQLIDMTNLVKKRTQQRADYMAQATKTPLEKLADDWILTTDKMQQATASWASDGIDRLMDFTRTGKLEFGSLVVEILAGMAKMEMQNAFGKMMGGTSGGGSGGSWMGALATWAGSFFAKGGIMTGKGPVPLKTYAKGGIANSPQMAIFGEGDQNEAYVPLPDGRRIPVALEGSGQAAPANVAVNVINQTGQPVQARQGQTRFDGKQAVLDVVLQAMNTPGAFRDNMKGSMQ